MSACKIHWLGYVYNIFIKYFILYQIESLIEQGIAKVTNISKTKTTVELHYESKIEHVLFLLGEFELPRNNKNGNQHIK